MVRLVLSGMAILLLAATPVRSADPLDHVPTVEEGAVGAGTGKWYQLGAGR